MKKHIIPVITSLLIVLCLVACSKDSENKQQTLESTSESVTDITEATDDTTSKQSHTAVVYFSVTGNTKAVAEAIAEKNEAKIFEILPAEKYTDEDIAYGNSSCRANTEQNDDNARPKIQNDLSFVKDYDTIYVGYPIWWGTNPRIIQTFIENYDLSAAEIHLFCTSGSSGIEKSKNDLQNLYPQLKITDGIRYADASDV